VRRFRTPFEVQFQPGLNLLIGPNESGKSTLVRAIRAAFFERYTTTGVEDLRPWDDPSASPEVEIEFEWSDQTWRLTKRFLGRKRCDLSIDGERLSNELAENRIAELLGYRYAGRGGSRPELWGVPGLLWVDQGQAQELSAPIQHAADRLHIALAAELDAMTSSAGDEVLGRIARLRDELLTGRGAPRGELKAACERRDSLRATCDTLTQRVARYRQDVERLDHLRQEQARCKQLAAKQQLLAQLREAQTQLARAEALERDHEHLLQRLTAIERERVLIEHRLDHIQQLEHALAGRHAALDRERETLAELVADRAALTSRLQQARQALEALYTRQKELQRGQRRRDLLQQLQQAETNRQRLQTALQQACQADQTLLELQRQMQGIQLDPEVLNTLRELHTRIHELELRQLSIATRVRYRLIPGASLRLGETDLRGEGESVLTAPQILYLPELGEISIEPGGTDLGSIARELSIARTAFESLLQRQGLRDLTQAESHVARRRQIEEHIRQTRERLQWLAPDGLDALKRDLALAEASVTQLKTACEPIPDPSLAPGDPSEADRLEIHIQGAQARLAQLEAADHRLADQIIRTEVGLKHLTEEQRRIETELDQIEHTGGRAHFERRASELSAEVADLKRQQAERERQLADLGPDRLRQDIERLNLSLEVLRRQEAERYAAILKLESGLEALGAEGLDEQLQLCRGELEQVERRWRELDTRARALDLLYRTLAEKRDQVRRKIQAPLVARLHHYLQIVFPGAQIRLDETLRPHCIARAAELADLDALSFGTREQIGLISRLAYADLFQAAGHPTLIILDDALVHSDRARLAQMKRVLFDAAQRHQVLILSCHPEDWIDLGAQVQSLEHGDHLGSLSLSRHAPI